MREGKARRFASVRAILLGIQQVGGATCVLMERRAFRPHVRALRSRCAPASRNAGVAGHLGGKFYSSRLAPDRPRMLFRPNATSQFFFSLVRRLTQPKVSARLQAIGMSGAPWRGRHVCKRE